MAKFTEEQRQAASERMKAMHAAKKDVREKQEIRKNRVPVGARRDITAVKDTPEGYVDRWVNDNPGRIQKFRDAGYEFVPKASVGDSGVDGTHNEDGVVSRDMGKNVTAYLMRQRKDYFQEDQAEKQKLVDQTEESMRRSKNETRSDGLNGEVKIGR